MDSQEYQRRRQALEEQLQADLSLIRAGYEAKLRALERIWLTSDGPSPPLAETVPDEAVTSETVPAKGGPETNAADAAEESAVASASDRRDTLSDLLKALPALAKEFDKSDISRALGYTPSRATLYRVLTKLEKEGKIATVQSSQGRTKTLYRAL